MKKAITHSNAQGYYMEIALFKNYFHLAMELLQFHQCRMRLCEKESEEQEDMSFLWKIYLKDKKNKREMFRFQSIHEEMRSMNINQVVSLFKTKKDLDQKSIAQNSCLLLNNQDILKISKDRKKSIQANSSNSRILPSNTNLLSIESHNNIDENKSCNRSIHSRVEMLEDNKNKNQSIFIYSLNTNKNYAKSNTKRESLNKQRQLFGEKNNLQVSDKNLSKMNAMQSSIQSSNNKVNEKGTAIGSKYMININFDSSIKNEKENPILSQKNQLQNERPCFLRTNTLLKINPSMSQLSLNFIPNNKPQGEIKKNTRRMSKYSNTLSNSQQDAHSVIYSENIPFGISSERKGIEHSLSHSINLSQRDIYSEEDEEEVEEDLFNIHKIKEGKIKLNIQLLIIEELKNGQTAFHCLCLLSTLNLMFINSNYLENISTYIISEDAIAKCHHPLIFIALSAEFLISLSQKHPKIREKAESVVTLLLQLADSLQNSMKNEEMLYYYLKEQYDHNGRNALEIYAENGFYSLLNDISVESIVNKLWYGSENELNLFQYFSLARILLGNIIQEQYSSLSNKHTFEDETIFHFQYSHYIKSCSIRYLFDSAFIIIVAILYQYIVYNYVIATKEKGYSAITSFKNDKIGRATHILMLISLLNYLLMILFVQQTKRKLKFNVLEFVVNFIMLIIIIWDICDGTQKYFPLEQSPEMSLFFQGIIYSIMLAMSWMKVILLLITTSVYGPLFRTLFNIWFDVFYFILIGIAITFLFSQCFTIFFNKTNKDFEEIYISFITLFGTAFGDVKFDSFTSLEIFGYIFLMLYSILSNIMLFNLIVGIINNLFSDLQDKVNAENNAMLLLQYERIKWDDQYGLLILLPAPFNLLSLFGLPFIFWKKDTCSYWNNLLSKVFYFPIALLIFIFMIIFGILVYPITLGKSIIHSWYESYISNASSLTKICQIIKVIFVHPLDLFILFCNDLYYFWKYVYKTPSKASLQHNHSQKEYSKTLILSLRKILNILKYKELIKTIHISELYHKIGIDGNCSSIKQVLPELKQFDKNHFMKATTCDDYSVYSSKVYKSHFELALHLENKEKSNMITLIDRMADLEGFLDIEKALCLLPDRGIYSYSFIDDISHMNMRVITRGIQKFFFLKAINNPVYQFKRLQMILYKLMIKVYLMYYYFPNDYRSKIHLKMIKINPHPTFNKAAQTLQQMDNASEYDDEGDDIKRYIATFVSINNDSNNASLLSHVSSSSSSSSSSSQS